MTVKTQLGAFPAPVSYSLSRTPSTYGCSALGYVDRDGCRDAVEEDLRYETFLKNRGFPVISVGDGAAILRQRRTDTPQAYDDLLAAGCQLDHHESDLYVKDTEEARAVLRKHGVRFQPFRSQTDGMSAWLDVPFAWAPFWREKAPR